MRKNERFFLVKLSIYKRLRHFTFLSQANRIKQMSDSLKLNSKVRAISTVAVSVLD